MADTETQRRAIKKAGTCPQGFKKGGAVKMPANAKYVKDDAAQKRTKNSIKNNNDK